MPEASNSELKWVVRKGLNGVRTNMVRNEWHGTEAGQQVVSKEYGPVINEAGRLSPLRIKEIEGLMSSTPTRSRQTSGATTGPPYLSGPGWRVRT